MKNRFFKNIAKDVFWNLYGGTIRNPPIPLNIKSMLFVCKGNICRSPFAEHIATKRSVTPNRYAFYSAGIHVKDQVSPPSEAIIAAKDFGVDLKGHKSRLINYDLIESNDLIIAMETSQYKFLRRVFLEFREKIILLPLLGKKNNVNLHDKYFTYNIKDPYGKDLSEFTFCYQRIDDCLGGLFEEINKN